MWRVMKVILSITVFAAVLVVVEDAKRRPMTFNGGVFLYLALIASLLWACHEVAEVWHNWEPYKESDRDQSRDH